METQGRKKFVFFFFLEGLEGCPLKSGTDWGLEGCAEFFQRLRDTSEEYVHKHGNLERKSWLHIAECLGSLLGNAAGEGTWDTWGSPTWSPVGTLCQSKKTGTLSSCSSFLKCSHQFHVTFVPSVPSLLTASPRISLNLSPPPSP